MKRRQFLRYAQGSLIVSLAGGIASHWPAQAAGALSIRALGHTCFLMTGGGARVLVNPFRPIGCTANYPAPLVDADLVLISSRQLDEGVVEGLPGSPKLLFEPGTYSDSGLTFQGVRTLHDRVNGFRFGTNVVWKWTQAGLNLVHMGGIASPVSLEQKILLGQPDVLFIPVGGTDETYRPDEAKAAIGVLQPKLVIPTHYRTAAADVEACDLQALQDFLTAMSGTPVQQAGSSLSLSSGQVPASTVIQVMNVA